VWYPNVMNAPANTGALLVVAAGQQLLPPWSLQPLGAAPGCRSQLPLDPSVVALFQLTDAGGYCGWAIPVPGGPMFNDFPLATQVAALDAFVPGGFVVSNAAQIRLGIEPPAAILTSQGNATAASGQVLPFCLVTFFN
jgi:hypothetical protein